MAGSGTGRGRTAFTFNIDALGFGKGAALPDTVSKPPPTYPVSTASILEHSLCV